MRFWIAEAGLARHAALLPVDGEERDPQRFWLSVLGTLRETAPGSVLVRPLTAAPHLDGWAIVERLLADLAPLADRVWLVIDDVHELGPDACGSWSCWCCARRRACALSWQPGTTCGWGCTGCGWRAS